MTEIFFGNAEGSHEWLKGLLSRHIPAPIAILKGKNGKPYISGDPLFFSLSHSGDRAAAAICTMPVGIDLEVYGGGVRQSVLKRFTERERAQTPDEKSFLANWTAKEAFIKMKGECIWKYAQKLEFYGGEIYFDGVKQNCEVRIMYKTFGVAAVCLEKES